MVLYYQAGMRSACGLFRKLYDGSATVLKLNASGDPWSLAQLILSRRADSLLKAAT
jgi:hypothetical protein